jgi:hypothetical protein
VSTGTDRLAAGSALASAITATLATACAIATGCMAYNADQRTQRQERLKIADDVQIEEAAPIFQKEFAELQKKERGNAPWRVLRNGSNQQISGVWVQLKDNKYLDLMDVGSCNIYALPAGSFPVAVFFSDGERTWKRQYNKSPEETSGNPRPTGIHVTPPWGPLSLGSC